jgi:hypothetical protein
MGLNMKIYAYQHTMYSAAIQLAVIAGAITLLAVGIVGAWA